jgi:preprotein translocase subunit SecD
VLLTAVAALALAGCTNEVTGEPGHADEVVTATELAVPIELCPVQETPTLPPSTEPPPPPSPRPSPTVLPDPSGEQLALDEPIMTVRRLDTATVRYDQVSTAWVLELDLNDEDTATFADWTAAHTGERLAVVVDGEVVVAPQIQSAITGGIVQLSGNYTQDEARELLDRITGR